MWKDGKDFERKTEKIGIEGRKVQERINSLKEKLTVLRREEMTEHEKERKGKGWWDGECREKKKEMRMKLRLWRREKEEKDKYRKVKREYKKLCEKKKEEEKERLMKLVEEAKTEGKIWELLRNYREKKKA